MNLFKMLANFESFQNVARFFFKKLETFFRKFKKNLEKFGKFRKFFGNSRKFGKFFCYSP